MLKSQCSNISNLNNHNKIMDKKLLVFICVIAIFLLASVFLIRDVNPENDLYGHYWKKATNHPYMMFSKAKIIYKSAPEIRLIAGICGLLLVGYLFWTLYRKVQQYSQTDLEERENSLYKVSLETGQTEYDLFRKSAKDWAVSDDRIEQDFRRYMSDQVLPYYVKDFVRRNCENIDESLIKNEETKPTSWWDLAKALLVFPGSIFIPIIILSIW